MTLWTDFPNQNGVVSVGVKFVLGSVSKREARRKQNHVCYVIAGSLNAGEGHEGILAAYPPANDLSLEDVQFRGDVRLPPPNITPPPCAGSPCVAWASPQPHPPRELRKGNVVG